MEFKSRLAACTFRDFREGSFLKGVMRVFAYPASWGRMSKLLSKYLLEMGWQSQRTFRSAAGSLPRSAMALLDGFA